MLDGLSSRRGPRRRKRPRSGELRRAIRAAIARFRRSCATRCCWRNRATTATTRLATMLGAPIGTIKWRVSEARRIVKQRLCERGARAHVRMTGGIDADRAARMNEHDLDAASRRASRAS